MSTLKGRHEHLKSKAPTSVSERFLEKTAINARNVRDRAINFYYTKTSQYLSQRRLRYENVTCA